MAERYKINRKFILNFAKKIGYDPNKNHPKLLSKEDEAYIVSMYNSMSGSKLAKDFNISTSKIHQIWMQNGLSGKVNRTYYFNENYFEIIDTEDKAYFLGLLASDGCIYNRNKNKQQNTINITLQKCDKHILDSFMEYINSDKPISSCVINGREYASIEQSSDKMCRDLMNYGMGFNKTYKCIWPYKLEKDMDMMRHFIRGYFDGDGCISHNLHKNSLHSVNISIAGYYKNLKLFKYFLNNNGIKSILAEDKREYKGEDKFGALVFTNKKEKVKFLHYIYDDSNIYLDRKFKLAQKFIALCEK